ncbi:MAG: SLBB domain-containing protein, partial [Bacteroidales bacterium]|nr:SLBB domain-containing protein [Bacteroidales bacterium]
AQKNISEFSGQALGKVRTIRVNLVGELAVPGTYRLSAFSTLFNALYRAGGVSPVGSLRAIDVVRGGERIATVDLYRYLFDGRQDENVPLQEGDVIVVPAYHALVGIEGGVKRPMFYELKDGETVEQLLAYAGGFSGEAYRGALKVTRKDGRQMRIFTVPSDRMGSFQLVDGDAVDVAVTAADVFANMVEIRGSVYRPGFFELGREIATVRQLIDHAGGLLDDAFLGRAQIIREKQDRSLALVPVPLKGIMDGTASDIMLKKNDILIISNVNEIEEKGDLTITGYVNSPGKYQFAEHTTVEDLILLAGGLSEGASSVRVDVSRRINNAASKEASDTLARIYTFGVKDGLFVSGEADFELEPFDVVAVRRSPTYVEQRIVTVSGEVTFPGQYVLVNTNERVSDLVRRAGGATPNGNIRGGMLKRKINQYERNVRTAMARMVKQGSGRDSLDAKKIMVSEIYTVGLELDKALEKPGSDYDMVLRDGDELIIPATASTVRVQGEVLYPNTVHYISGKPVRYYVHQAGGFSNRARRTKTYVVYMNGTVAVGAQARLEPGCEIIVPSRPEKDKLTASEWLGIGTAAASITTMVATIINMLK